MKKFQYPNGIIMELLPPQITRDNFIKGRDKYSYEEYLTEFVNSSEYFCEEKGISRYNHIKKEKQSNGEYDCVSENGDNSLEFKLICSEKGMKAKQFTCFHEGVDSNGCRFLYYPSKDGLVVKEKYEVGITSTIAKKLDENLIQAIRNDDEHVLKENDKFFIDEARPLINEFSINKNVLYLYDGYFYKNEKSNDIYSEVIELINDRFKKLLKFRNDCTTGDTYIAVFVEDYLLICKYDEEVLREVDRLNIKRNKLLNDLLRISIFNSEIARKVCLDGESH